MPSDGRRSVWRLSDGLLRGVLLSSRWSLDGRRGSRLRSGGLPDEVWWSTGWSSGLARLQGVGGVGVIAEAGEGGVEPGFASRVPVAPGGGGHGLRVWCLWAGREMVKTRWSYDGGVAVEG